MCLIIRYMNIYGLGVGSERFQRYIVKGVGHVRDFKFQTFLQNYISIFIISKQIRTIPSVVREI